MALRDHPDELLADFQETYRIDLWGTDWDDIREDQAAHVAALAYQLRRDSRTRTAMYPASSHGIEAQLLRAIEHNQRLWHWAHTKDAKSKDTEPQQITLPGEEEAYERSVEQEERKASALADAFGLKL